MPISNNINAIIFDIGNVLIDIDYEVMISRFTEMANIDFHQIVTFAHQHPVFDQYEKGQISSAEFRAALRRYLRPEAQDAEIDTAWNSMLIHYPPAKFELLKRLRGQYKLFALSNINELHADAIEADVRARFGGGMRSYFDRRTTRMRWGTGNLRKKYTRRSWRMKIWILPAPYSSMTKQRI
ncbi:unnamed protein product [Sphagnum jensenii]|uniref:Uncharacterized protein n=2 Tax=Sphagnum jensenii TaxID=128206 RepID=A0ABP1A075_9BRYO